MDVTVAGSLDNLEVVTLTRRDVAETGTTSHDIDDHYGDLGRGDVAKPFLHQTDPQPRRTGHRAHAGGGSAVEHDDRRDLALGSWRKTSLSCGMLHAMYSSNSVCGVIG
jgi:hypothetical protein